MAHSQGGAERRPGGRCPRPTAVHPFLAGRSPRTHARALGGGLGVPLLGRGASRRGTRRHRRDGRVAFGEARRHDRSGAPGRGIPRCGPRRAGRDSVARHPRPRAVLRRQRRHAARRAFALRQSHQSRVGPRATKAILSALRFRAPGRRDRRCDRAFARPDAQFSARGSVRVPSRGVGPRAHHPGGARCADVQVALALERDARARRRPLARRKTSAATVSAYGRGRPRGRRIPGPGGVSGQPARSARSAGPSAGQADDRRLPRRGDGHSRVRGASARHCRRAEEPRRQRHDRAVSVRAGDPHRASIRVSRRRTARGAPHASGLFTSPSRRAFRVRSRRARRFGDRARARRSVARAGERGRTPRSARSPRVSHRPRGERGGLVRIFRRAVRRRTRHVCEPRLAQSALGRGR